MISYVWDYSFNGDVSCEIRMKFYFLLMILLWILGGNNMVEVIFLLDCLMSVILMCFYDLI